MREIASGQRGQSRPPCPCQCRRAADPRPTRDPHGTPVRRPGDNGWHRARRRRAGRTCETDLRRSVVRRGPPDAFLADVPNDVDTERVVAEVAARTRCARGRRPRAENCSLRRVSRAPDSLTGQGHLDGRLVRAGWAGGPDARPTRSARTRAATSCRGPRGRRCSRTPRCTGQRRRRRHSSERSRRRPPSRSQARGSRPGRYR